MDNLLRSGFRTARALIGEWTGRNARAIAQLDGSRAAIFTYHRVLPTIEAKQRGVEPGMFVTPETFARHAEWIADEFTVLPLSDLVSAFEHDEMLPERACAITFDDGWLDNYTYAWPSLKRHGLPATIFLVAGRVGSDGGFWTDGIWPAIQDLSSERCRALVDEPVDSPTALLNFLKALPPDHRRNAIERIRTALNLPEASTARELMNWEEVDVMAKSGVSFECHGNSHDLLTTIDDTGIEQELRQAQETLRARGLGSERLLAYPNGSWDERVGGIARREGIRAAVTTRRALAGREDPLHSLPRIGVHDDISRTRACFRRLIPTD